LAAARRAAEAAEAQRLKDEQLAALAAEAARLAKVRADAVATAMQVALPEPLAADAAALPVRLAELHATLLGMSVEDMEYAIRCLYARKDEPAFAALHVTAHVPALLRAMHATCLAHREGDGRPEAKRAAVTRGAVRDHGTGSARSEGYYFVSYQNKRAGIASGACGCCRRLPAFGSLAG
jgi:hypothetical protein